MPNNIFLRSSQKQASSLFAFRSGFFSLIGGAFREEIGGVGGWAANCSLSLHIGDAQKFVSNMHTNMDVTVGRYFQLMSMEQEGICFDLPGKM